MGEEEAGRIRVGKITRKVPRGKGFKITQETFTAPNLSNARAGN